MREVARLAQLGDVPLCSFLRDAERSGGFEVGCAAEGIRKGFEEGLATVAGNAMATGFVEVVARQGLKDRCRVLQQDFDHRESGGKVRVCAR